MKAPAVLATHASTMGPVVLTQGSGLTTHVPVQPNGRDPIAEKVSGYINARIYPVSIYSRSTIASPAKRHLNGVSLVSRLRTDFIYAYYDWVSPRKKNLFQGLQSSRT